MSKLNALFRKRIGISQSEHITFQTLNHVLEKTAKAIPFENLRVISKQLGDMTKYDLVDRILVKNEGGLCYDLNAILYFFLVENGFHVSLLRGAVYNHTTQDWHATGRTHVTILLTHDQHTYLVDTGFGTNLPLRPVPLSGETVKSKNGEFRIKQTDSAYGDYQLEFKLKHKDKDWKIGYTFDSERAIDGVSELVEVRNIIVRHPESAFNKNPLMTRITDRGTITLTDSTFTQRIDGEVKKEDISEETFKALKKDCFGIDETILASGLAPDH